MAHQQQQNGCPAQVGGPGIRIDEYLDHQCHAQQRQRRQPREQAKREEQRKQMLGVGGEVSGECRVQQGELEFVGEQRDGAVGHVELLVHLGAAGLPEHGGDPQAGSQREQVGGDQGLQLEEQRVVPGGEGVHAGVLSSDGG